MSLSLVIPVYNEADNIELLHQAIQKAMSNLSETWDVVYVDDGSSDNSLELLEQIHAEDPEHAIVVALRRNFGQTAAIAAGIDYANGDIICLLDADLQNDPDDIPMMLGKIHEGYDVVSGWRINRQDKFVTRTLPSRAANFLISEVTGVHLHDYGCTLKAYRREVLTGFRLYGEMHRFIPAYAYSVGAKITEVPVKHHPRRFGKTKYGLNRTIKVILDLFTVKFLISYSNKPIYLFGGTGVILILISLLTMLFLLVRRFGYQISVFSSPLFILSILFMILGFQSILMGLMAELLARTYHESQSKPIYTIRHVRLSTTEQSSTTGENVADNALIINSAIAPDLPPPSSLEA
ncbi:MAG: putative glycosyltransferase [Chloroflexi bacterium]|jgi:glycosyltransferase involved in cell wall biosynthesis|nr:putative glycosyltransferase [Chloroflexota bacterium]